MLMVVGVVVVMVVALSSPAVAAAAVGQSEGWCDWPSRSSFAGTTVTMMFHLPTGDVAFGTSNRV